MEAVQESIQLLSLAARKGLIPQASAAGIKQQIESGIHPAGAKPLAQMLVAQGHLTSPQADLLLGEFAKAQGPKIIGGHQLTAKLGQGGMGAVFKAIQLSMQREVAIKVLAPQWAKNQEFVERFVREARAAGRVQHANVIQCYDVGVDQGTPYMSLELVQGGDALKHCQASGGKLPEREALTIIRDCARGLEAIHKAGLIHRDLKPANIFLTEDGAAKIADLGLARSQAGDDRMTQTGATMGSPAYMSPEQAQGAHDLDIRSDIYALGASLFHLVCGQPPYTASSVFATVAKVISEPVPDPRVFTPTLSTGCAQVIRHTMAKDRTQRPQTPEALLALIDALLDGSQPTLIAAPGARAQRHTHHHDNAPRSAPAKPPVALIAGGAAVVLVIVGILAFSGGDAPPPATAAAPVLTVAAVEPASSVAAPTTPVAAKPTVSESKPKPEPVRAAVREAVVERVAERVGAQITERTAERAPAPAKPSAPELADEPAWAPAAGPVLDRLVANDLPGALTAAQTLPSEYRDALLAVQQARGDQPKLFAAHQTAIVAAKPALAALPKGTTLTGVSAKNLAVRDAEQGFEAGVPWKTVGEPDLAILRALVAKDAPSEAEQRQLACCTLSAESIAAADPATPVLGRLRQLHDVRTAHRAAEAAAQVAAKAKAEAETKAAKIGGEPRTKRVLRQIAEVTSLTPTIIRGELAKALELHDFTVIAKGTRLAPGGRLIPTPGALVINFAEQIGYQPVALRGLPFISISGSPAHTAFIGGDVREGIRFENCIFYGNCALDGAGSPQFSACTFLGSGLKGLDFPLADAFTLTATFRPRQFANCDFSGIRFQEPVIPASSDQCYFADCTISGSRGPERAGAITGWDPSRHLQAQLDAAVTRGCQPLRLKDARGTRADTPFAGDSPLIAQALDEVLRSRFAELAAYAR